MSDIKFNVCFGCKFVQIKINEIIFTLKINIITNNTPNENKFTKTFLIRLSKCFLFRFYKAFQGCVIGIIIMLYLGHNGGNLKFLYRNFHFGKSKTYFGKINLQKSQYCAGRMYFCPQNRWKNVLTITYCFLTSENLHTFRKSILLSTYCSAKKLSVQYKPPIYKPTICQVHNPHIHIQVSNWYFL